MASNNDDSHYILTEPASFSKSRGILILTPFKVIFKPDPENGKRQDSFEIKIEDIINITIEGKMMKRLCLIVKGISPKTVLVKVTDMESWKTHIEITKKILSHFSQSKISQQTGKQKKKTEDPPGGSSQSLSKDKSNPSWYEANRKIMENVLNELKKKKLTALEDPQGSWPSGRDYEQSFQSLQHSIYKDLTELQTATPIKNPASVNLYVHATGNYGSIYKVRTVSGQLLALKCFTKRTSHLNMRYLELSSYLKGINYAAYPLIKFDFYTKGIMAMKNPSVYYPLLTMEWIDGTPLNTFINANLKDHKMMKKLAKDFINSVAQMHSFGIAHGDLSGDNIIIDKKGKMIFVDYDGMYVPLMEGQKAPELGHSGFQHPARKVDHYGPNLDNFSSIVIFLSLLALAEKPDMWKEYNDEDPDCLIMRKEDFNDPDHSKVIRALSTGGGRKVKKLTKLLIQSISKDPLWEGTEPMKLISL
ncbi:AarF/UbiB family protein [Oxyplasma meridianum]|uniref:AarF/UbiB family protein n=1 Tax=Oxyplasma meridianum TaxID=3073602 RepID=A0AAX4NH42_9ARCH